jgi:hypothetical protein
MQFKALNVPNCSARLQVRPPDIACGVHLSGLNRDGHRHLSAASALPLRSTRLDGDDDDRDKCAEGRTDGVHQPVVGVAGAAEGPEERPEELD